MDDKVIHPSEALSKQDYFSTNEIETGTPTRSKSVDYEGEDCSELISKIVPPRDLDPLPVDPLALDLLAIETFDEHLPSTVSLLKNPEGAKVYLVGTAHYSTESRDDVSTVIRNVRPHIVVLELCESRLDLLLLDEETIERESKDITLECIMATIKEYGISYGLIHIMFAILSARATKDLGTANGGELRTALSEVRKLQNCRIYLGDVPTEVTYKRILSVLSWWQCICFAWFIVFSGNPFTKEDMEKLKHKDILEDVIKEDLKECPKLTRVFLEERDIYLTFCLQQASHLQPPRLPTGAPEPTRVVGIVGMGHVPGITKLWGTVKHSDIPPIMNIPSPSKISQTVEATIKIAVIGFALWVVYKLFAPMTVLDAIGRVASAVTQVGLYDRIVEQ